MVVFSSRGGLGNQLFQYATARRIGAALGVEVAADTSWHHRALPDTTPRPFVLPQLRVRLAVLTQRERLWARAASHPLLGRLPLPLPWKLRRERAFAFDPTVLACGDETYLYGYWQSPRYFDEIRATLLAEFVPVEPPSANDREAIDAMAGCESVLVHVRRGDYVTLGAAAAYHGTCSPAYYAAAFGQISARVRAPVMFVFSDDPEWARANVRFPADTRYVDHNSPDAAAQDLHLMSACRHAIIANSSFSWWGAWLGTNEGQVVVAPRRWFANGPETPDLFPPTWLSI